MRVYLSGPMSGLPDENFPAFMAVAAVLRLRGIAVVNPAELNPGVNRPGPNASPREVRSYWHDCIRVDMRELTDCDVIVLLPGWQYSDGAHSELSTARDCGLQIVMLEDVLPRELWGDIPFPPVTLLRGIRYGEWSGATKFEHFDNVETRV